MTPLIVMFAMAVTVAVTVAWAIYVQADDFEDFASKVL